MYIPDHHNERVQMWLKGATSGTTIASKTLTGGTDVKHAEYLTVDKNHLVNLMTNKLVVIYYTI